LKPGTVLAIDSLSKPVDFGFRKSKFKVGVRVLACGSDMPECGGRHEI